MLEVSESPQPTQSIELHRDQNKNVWFIFNCEPQVTSIIDGQVKSRAVVTPNGLKFAHGKRRDELLLRALHQQLQNNGTLGRPGAEGVVKKMTDAKNPISQLLHFYEKDAAVKTYTVDKETVPLNAWETVAIFDQIRPFFNAEGMRLIEPYGATNQQLFNPIIKGYNLAYVLDQMEFSTRDAVRKELLKRTQNIHDKTQSFLREYLTNKGLKLVEMNEKTNIHEYMNPLYPDERIRMMTDLHANPHMKIDKYVQWLMPKATADLAKKTSPSEALEIILQNTQCVDPFLISGKTAMWLRNRERFRNLS